VGKGKRGQATFSEKGSLTPFFAPCLLLALACSAPPQEARFIPAHAATIPVPREGRWIERHEQINAQVREHPPDLVFIGDSITQGWESAGKEEWDRRYAPRNAANLGISGDRTQHVLWRLDHGNLEGITPKVAVVMIGTNNSGDDRPERIADGIEAIVKNLRAFLPRARILLLAIFPRGEDASDARRRTNEETNRRIAGLADGKWIHFLDIGSRFTRPDGTISRDVMPDLLHLSPAGYAIWGEAMEPTLARLLRE